MIMLNKKLTCYAAAGIAVALFASCSNELNDVNSGTVSGPSTESVKLVKNPVIAAWSGDYALTGKGVYALSENVPYDWNFPAEMAILDNITIPEDAIELQDDWVWVNSHQDYSGNLVIPENTTRTFQVPLHFTGNLYVAGTYSPHTLGNNDGVTVYVLPDGELNVDEVSTEGNTIYNAGTLNMKNFDGKKVKNVFNTGDLYLGSLYGGLSLPGGVGIYNKGGYVELATNGQDWAVIDIMGSIVSDNIVKSNGNIKFQSNEHRDICTFISTGNVEMIKGDISFGEITAPNLKFDGAKINLHPNGLVNIENTIEIPNSGCGIIPAANSVGLVKCAELKVMNTGDQPSSIFPEGIYFNISADKISYNPDNFNGLDYIKNRINTTLEVIPNCSALSEGDENNDETGDTGDGKEEDIKYPTTSEVEVNLSINDTHYDVEDFVSKLSIHVRYANDVRINIPIPAQYYLDVDDLYILNKHEDGLGVYGTEHNAEYDIAGFKVTLNVSYSEDGITVTTNGINQNVFDYCVENFRDGLNFEIYNYFVGRVQNADGDWVSSDLSVADLQEYLNKSTIEFIDNSGNTLNGTECPDYYINAFGNRGEYNGNEEPENGYDPTVSEDCKVTIDSAQANDYGNGVTGGHLNNSEDNVIYKNNYFEGEPGEHDHGFLWGKSKSDTIE